MKEQLLKKIENKEIEVGVVGLGYVGLPLAVEKAKAGFKTIGFDVQEEQEIITKQYNNFLNSYQEKKSGNISQNELLEKDINKIIKAKITIPKDIIFIIL